MDDTYRPHIGWQEGETLNNVVGTQVNHVLQRESFLRDIAAARTRARYLVAVGFLMTAGGCILAAAHVLVFMNEIGTTDPSTMLHREGFAETAFSDGLPLFAAGSAVALIGQFLLIAGIVLHIVAAARRRRLREWEAMSRWAWNRTGQ